MNARKPIGVSKIVFAVGCLAFIGGGAGCATSKPPQTSSALQEYRKIMERQKAEITADEKAAQKVPKMTAAGYERSGDHYLSQGNLDLAFMQYHKALQMDSGLWRVRYKIGRLFLAKGLNEEAKREFQDVLSANPRQVLAYEGLGQVYFQMGQYSEAEKNFKKALEGNPSLWQAHNYLGILSDRRRDWENAVAHYRAAIATQPKKALLYNNLGASLLLKGENEKALETFAEAARLESSDLRIHNNLAFVLGKLGRYPEAFAAFKKGGDEASAHYNLGCIYLWKGKPKEAVAAFEKAVEMKPGFYVKAHEKLKKARESVVNSFGPRSQN